MLTNSTKELAKKFRDEVFSNILSTIRKTGPYNVENKDKLKKLNNEIIQLKNIEKDYETAMMCVQMSKLQSANKEDECIIFFDYRKMFYTNCINFHIS